MAKTRRKRSKRPNPNYTVYDSRGKALGKTKSKKGAKIMARVTGGHVTRKGQTVYSAQSRSNPQRSKALPVGRMVTVKARRRADGRIDLYR